MLIILLGSGLPDYLSAFNLDSSATILSTNLSSLYSKSSILFWRDWMSVFEADCWGAEEARLSRKSNGLGEDWAGWEAAWGERETNSFLTSVF